MIEADKKTFSFGDFELSGAKRTLLKQGEIISLNSKTFDLLFTLIENHGKILSKDELLDKVWEGQFVEENNLTVQISALRKIFGESKNENKFIATIPGKGYKFVAEISVSANENSRDLIVLEKSLPVSTRKNFETSLIGRTREIAEIKDLLRQDEVCLLTLTGAGGSGKTALAREIATELESDFAGGVFFVELAAATDTDLVVSAIANTLGITESGGKSLVEAVKDFLQTRQTLLILDNFEQVLSAAPLVKEFLAESAQIKIIVTSRAALHLKSEREFPVQPLDAPPPNAAFSIEKLNEFPAIELFKTRAQSVRPNFALTDENIKIIAEICRRLDGLPLAIELAAVRVRLLSPDAILERLENSLNLLTGGAKDLPIRQRTMRGAIQWSYELLDEEEKSFFRRLAIFAGSFSIEAGETVGEREKGRKGEREIVAETSVSPSRLLTFSRSSLDLLTALIDNNLLVSKELTDGNVRLQMLEVVREFAVEVLQETDELDDLQKNHAAYFLSLAEKAEAFLNSETSENWLEKLEQNHDNLRSALRWSLENDNQTAARIASALRFFWSTRSHLNEGLNWSAAALKMTENSVSPARSKLLLSNGLFLRNTGNLEAAKNLYEKCVAENGESGDTEQLNKAFQGLGSIAVLQKDYVSARNFYQKSLTMSREANDEAQLAYILGALGDLEMCEENLSAARALVEESLNLSKKHGNKRVQTVMYFNLGTIDYLENLYESAFFNFAESLQIAEDLRNKTMIACALEGFAACAAAAGNYAQSAKLAGATDTLREEIGYKTEPAEEIFRAEYLTKTRAALSENQFSALYLQGQNLNSDEAVAIAFHKQLAGQTDFADENYAEIIIETHKFERITIDEKIEP